MAWTAPVSGSTTGYKAQGVTTIRWGTDGLLNSPKPSDRFYVVTRFNEQVLSEPMKYPNGNGVSTTRVIITDGVQWSITVRDDTQMVPPVVGGTVTIVDLGGFIATPGATNRYIYTATVINNNYDAAPKQPGERVLVVENLVAIESQTGS